MGRVLSRSVALFSEKGNGHCFFASLGVIVGTTVFSVKMVLVKCETSL